VRTTASSCALLVESWGINDQNIDRLLAQMDDNVTVIWLNAVSRGKAEVSDYRRMVGGDKAILSKYLTKATLGARQVLRRHCDRRRRPPTSSIDRARLFRLDSRWSSTIVKNAGEWKIVSCTCRRTCSTTLTESSRPTCSCRRGRIVAGLVAMFLIMRLRTGAPGLHSSSRNRGERPRKAGGVQIFAQRGVRLVDGTASMPASIFRRSPVRRGACAASRRTASRPARAIRRAAKRTLAVATRSVNPPFRRSISSAMPARTRSRFSGRIA
jgi:hypothetical protein